MAAHRFRSFSLLSRVFSTQYRVIGLQYGTTSFLFLLCGFLFMLLMRWQLAYPGAPLPFLVHLFGSERMPGGMMMPDFYNQLGAMHGTIMVFLAVVPLGVGAFGNYFVPRLIGAQEMAFPRINMLSYWIYLTGGVLLLVGFFLPGGGPESGWTSYPPLSEIAVDGQSFWLYGVLLVGVSSLLGSLNMIVTIVQLRGPGVGFMQLPFFVWAQLVSGFLLLLAFPALEAASVMQLMDRLAGTAFFMPSGLIVSGQYMTRPEGGTPILWQHLFWFLAHPEVYVLILPAMGIVAEVLTASTGRPLHGYRTLVIATIVLGVMSLLVWAHHMYLTGMGAVMSGFFQATTVIISIPSVLIITSFLLTLRGASIQRSTAMFFALAFLPMFGLVGLTGLPLAMAPTDIHLHDTMYVIGHFHYLVAPGTIFAFFAGVYHWFPAITGKQLGGRLGRIHFWGSLISMNGIFLPMFFQGLAGVSRRLYDGGMQYGFAQHVLHWNIVMSASAGLLGLSQIPFLVNLAMTLIRKKTVVRDGSENSEEVHPGESATNIFDGAGRRIDTGISNAALGMFLFLASETMLYGAFVASYVLIATNSRRGGGEAFQEGRWIAGFGVLLLSAIAMIICFRQENRPTWWRLLLSTGGVLGVLFVFLEWPGMHSGQTFALPEGNLLALRSILAGIHSLHVLGGAAASFGGLLWLGREVVPERRRQWMWVLAVYWVYQALVWLGLLALPSVF